jgi:hypothetical protein
VNPDSPVRRTNVTSDDHVQGEGTGRLGRQLTEGIGDDLDLLGAYGDLQPLITQDGYFRLPVPSAVPNLLMSGRASGAPAQILAHLDDHSIRVIPIVGQARPLGQPGARGAYLFRDTGAAGSSLKLARADGSVAVVEQLNTHLQGIERGQWYPLRYTSSLDSSAQVSCLLLPEGLERGKPLPLIAEVYPSKQHPCDPAHPAALDLSALRGDPDQRIRLRGLDERLGRSVAALFRLRYLRGGVPGRISVWSRDGPL